MKIEGLILAAGFSSRVGQNKLILDIGGKTVIERCIESMYRSCQKIVVVGGHRIDDIRYITKCYPKVQLVYHSRYQEGMFSSVMKGLSHIRGEGVFITPGDYPAIKEETYKQMLKSPGDIVVPTYNGKKGHPLLMKYSQVKELLNSHTYETLRDFVDKKGFIACPVDDFGILMDIDTMEDYRDLTYSVGVIPVCFLKI